MANFIRSSILISNSGQNEVFLKFYNLKKKEQDIYSREDKSL